MAVMMLGSLTACGGANASKGGTGGKGLKIVTTIFPEYDWVREILGEQIKEADLTMLLKNGVDLHSFQPTTEDIMKISECDLFIYVGGESDEWVEGALQEAVNKDLKVIDLLEVLGDGIKEEEVVEGMEAEEGEEESVEEETEYDEHVWLSLKNAQKLCKEIADTLGEIDPDHAKAYEENEKAYSERLASLDKEYGTAVSAAKEKTVLFGDRFPFRYMADDYGLNYYAAFVGCSAETEASFETITFLANKVDELSLGSILTIEGTEHKIADTIKENTQSKNQKILTMDSLQSTTSEDVERGVTYLQRMTENLEVLSEALN
ncbi:MAG: zinc ABC transporter substrate-binding protein [Lachnospiraceae bacterium]|nr:zinc ABC transporter substrate-binding protein [Lachnospiraceae bacterium]